jgi:hypothetical protein
VPGADLGKGKMIGRYQSYSRAQIIQNLWALERSVDFL